MGRDLPGSGLTEWGFRRSGLTGEIVCCVQQYMIFQKFFRFCCELFDKVLQYEQQISGKRVAVNKEAVTKCHAC